MNTTTDKAAKGPASVQYNICSIDLNSGSIAIKKVPCRNLEDVLGGFGRSFQLLAERDIKNAYSLENPLIVNTGLLTGTNVITGLRTYFSAYSPLKKSDAGRPSAMWSAASGKFGSKLKWTGIDEVIFEGCSEMPVYVVLSQGEEGPQVVIKSASDLVGLSTHEKVMALQERYADGHFAVIGPAGENYQSVSMGSVALSTENQLKSKEDKFRFAGRGGMGSLMGYKNLLAIVARGDDKLPKLAPEVRDINKKILKGEGAKKFRPLKTGGGGGTWSLYEMMQTFHAVPENNFRPTGQKHVEGLFRENVTKDFEVKAEGCFRCGIRCHNNIYQKNSDGTRGEFLAKYDFEPLNLLGSNLGINDGYQAAKLIQLCDNLGMDAISLGTTVSYLLDYNERHPDQRCLNGATFGDYEKIHELVQQTGLGKLHELGQGVKQLSKKLGETAYAMHVKGLELPAYLPETNPGYAFAIAGGHMSMFTHMNIVREGNTDLDYWVNSITQEGLYQVGFDMVGLCKFAGVGIGHELVINALKVAGGIEVSSEEVIAAVRRAYLRGLALEIRQGYQDDEYSLPAQVFEKPNENVRQPHFVTPEFFSALKAKVWEVFKPEMENLLPPNKNH